MCLEPERLKLSKVIKHSAGIVKGSASPRTLVARQFPTVLRQCSRADVAAPTAR
jgi:hypothetical protein